MHELHEVLSWRALDVSHIGDLYIFALRLN